MVSGMCVAPWFEILDAWMIRFFSAFAAALIIVSCYFTAPAARVLVAWVVFGLGAVYALWIAVVSWAWGEFIAAGVGGVAAVLLLTRGKGILREPVVLHHKTPDQRLQTTSEMFDVRFSHRSRVDGVRSRRTITIFDASRGG